MALAFTSIMVANIVIGSAAVGGAVAGVVGINVRIFTHSFSP
jgi:hypothetical protein